MIVFFTQINDHLSRVHNVNSGVYLLSKYLYIVLLYLQNDDKKKYIVTGLSGNRMVSINVGP